MRAFFKILFASLLALVIFSVVVFFVMGWIAGKAVESDKPEIESKTVLVLDLSKQLMEQSVSQGLSFPDGQTAAVNGLYDVVRAIKAAKTDSAVKGIYVKCGGNPNAFATGEELRNALLDFKTSKKFIIAYGNNISQNDFYVASAAEKLYGHPQGEFEWKGFGMSYIYLKGLLDMLGVKPEIFYAGQFKSATEPLREKQMTPANRLQSMAFLNDLYGHFLKVAAARTGSDTASLHALANAFEVQNTLDAVQYKLIDAVKYDDEVKQEIAQHSGAESIDKIHFMSLADYITASEDAPGAAEKIAIIYAQGDIVDGKGSSANIGGDTYMGLLRKARLDKNIKAVVLRINSGGGSGQASDIIWREVALTRKEKPVVVSMGDYAASGGYYIACNADSIFAQPNTLTGSIGVFRIYGNISTMLSTKLGITSDGVKTSPSADFGNPLRPMTDKEKLAAQKEVDMFYQTFKTKVAEGRKLPLTVVDSLAQGRVWSGKQALQLKLVDRLGNIQDAVDCAAGLAKLKTYGITELPAVQSFWEKILKTTEPQKAAGESAVIQKALGTEMAEAVNHLQTVKSWIGVPQARLPFLPTVK